MSTERAGIEPLEITLRTTMEIPGLEERARELGARKRLGARIRAARQSRGLRLEDLAARTGMPLSSLARLEMGEAPRPGPERLAALARVLEVAEGELLEEGTAGRQKEAPEGEVVPLEEDAAGRQPDLLGDGRPVFVIFDEATFEDLFG